MKNKCYHLPLSPHQPHSQPSRYWMTGLPHRGQARCCVPGRLTRSLTFWFFCCCLDFFSEECIMMSRIGMAITPITNRINASMLSPPCICLADHEMFIPGNCTCRPHRERRCQSRNPCSPLGNAPCNSLRGSLICAPRA